MGKFIGHVIVTPAAARLAEIDNDVFERVLEHQHDPGCEEEITACQCVGTVAQEEVDEMIRKRFGTGRARYEAFIAQNPTCADLSYECWRQPTDPRHRAAVHQFSSSIEEARRQALAEHPARARPEPNHAKCGGTGKLVVQGRAHREGLFDSFGPRIRGRGSVEDLLRAQPPFALFLPDRVAAISDRPATWQSFGATWAIASRKLITRHLRMDYVELEFIC